MKRKTTKQFIKEAKGIYGNLYDYSKVEYKNTMTKVIVICNTHGEWEVSPDNHIGKNSGCPKCKGFKLTKKEKIELADKIHQGKYDYSLIKSKDIKNQNSYPLICPKHGVFSQVWNNHYNMGQGCPKCNIGGRPKTLKEGEKSWSKEYTREYMNQYNINRRKTDTQYKILSYLRTRIATSIRDYRYHKKESTIKELGCSIEEYIKHLESQFSRNMNWDNHGEYWEIDHIIPLSKGGSFHYTNTQPLTITENRKKSNKI